MADVPSVGLYRSPTHEYWFDGAGPVPGVTGIIGRAVDKSGPLTGWAKRLTAQFAVDNLDWLLATVELLGKEATVTALASKAKAEKDAGAALGARIHYLIEDVGRGKDPNLTDADRPYVEAYRRFLREYRPKLLSLEKAVINLTRGFGGTFDIYAELDGLKWLIDAKTNRASGAPDKANRGLYKETALQLAAYGHAEFTALPDDPKKYPPPRPERYAVLHLRPDAYDRGYRLVEYTRDEVELAWPAFLGCIQVAGWVAEADPIGESVPMPEAVAAPKVTTRKAAVPA